MLYNEEKFRAWSPAGFDGLFDWDFIMPAFAGTKIRPMDLDCVIERMGHVLIFETKECDKTIPIGQAITLTRFWSMGCTIIHLVGKSPDTIEQMRVYAEGSFDGSKVGSRALQPCTSEDVLDIVRRWRRWAEDNPKS